MKKETTATVLKVIAGIAFFVFAFYIAGKDDAETARIEQEIAEEQAEIRHQAECLMERDNYLREHPEEFETKAEWADWCKNHPEQDIYYYEYMAEEDMRDSY